MELRYLALLPLIPLAALIAGDFRTREVSLLWLILFAALSLVTSFILNGFPAAFSNIAFNILLLIYMGLGIVVYLRIRTNRWINPLNNYIGWGDLVFLLSLTPLFDLRGYLVFLIAAFVFSLIWMAVTRTLSRKAETIPLVGTTGIVLSISMVIELFA